MKHVTHFFITLTAFLSFAANMALAQISITITNPVGKARFAVCSDIDINIETTGEIDKVLIYRNDVQFRSDSKAPYDYTWKNVPDGNYIITAKAVGTDGSEVWSDPVVVIVGNAYPDNLIQNGEFNCTVSPWRLDSYEGAVSSIELAPDAFLTEDSSAALIEISEVGSQTWGVQLMQAFRLQAGHSYEVSFVAEADDPKAIQITFSQDYDPWASYWYQDITVDKLAEYGPYIYDCDTEDAQVMFKFVIGGNKIAMYLDAVRVVDLNGIEAVPNVGAQIEDFQLFQNYPNPFNPETTIQYSLANSGKVTLSIYNALGEIVRLFSRMETPGTHEIKWNGRDAAGKALNSGMYIYKLESGDFSVTRKMMLVK